MKILLVDDHVVLREGLSYLLKELEENITIIEAGNCQQTMEYLQSQQEFDLVLLDLGLPDTTGFSCLDKISEYDMGLPIVILTGEVDKNIATEALNRGALGYIPKSSTSDVMLAAIKLVLAGETYIPSFTLNESQIDSPESKEEKILTNRQFEVLVLIAKGLSNKEISSKLGMTPGTVRIHVSAILNSLGVKNRTEAVKKAGELNLF